MLKQVLATNALFSAGSGLFILTRSDWLALQIPGPGWFWLLLGFGLLAFAAQLLAMVLWPALARKLTMQVVISDIAWLAATSIALIIFYGDISRTGVLLIVAINLLVALLAAMQYLGFRAASSAAACS